MPDILYAWHFPTNLDCNESKAKRNNTIDSDVADRDNATVYGVVSDGCSTISVTIAHDGVFKQGRRFEVTDGDVLTC